MSTLYTIPAVVIVPLVVVLVLAALEAGHRLGRVTPIAQEQASNFTAPVLAIVGLLLAFSFAMAADRHALRRAALVEEANAIGTFYLRTSLLSEPIRSEMQARVRRYVDLHFEHRSAKIDAARALQIEAEAERIQSELWGLLMREAQTGAAPHVLLLVTPALNAMIDDTATALAARENRLPDAIVVYLLFLIVVAGLTIGYRPREERRNLVLWGILVVVLGGILMLLLDIDRPRRGFIQTNSGPLLRLQESLKRDARCQPTRP